MTLNKLSIILEELRSLGVEGSLFRAYYELSLRTGLKKTVNRSVDIPEINIDIDNWRQNKKSFFLPSLTEARKSLNDILSEKQKENILYVAEKAICGEILCFSKWFGFFGNPVNWHINPKKKISWPSDIHWTRIMKYEKECGDIKLSWEINRFPHLYFIVRAYVLTGDDKYVKFFCSQLKDWEESNPYGHGINWCSGQELAIRLFAWIYALYMLGEEESFSEEDFQRFLRLLYLHTKHIEKNINYAYYAVRNNHLIGEALALYISGTLFPYFTESQRWKQKGKDILQSKRCIDQFYRDGVYCQLSFNYQRLALHYYLWALRIGEQNGDDLGEKILPILAKSAEFLYSFMNKEDGKLPNWGANDGALLNPWTSCDYNDYRPLINALSYGTRKKRAFEAGPWDEELLWFFGPKALEAEILPYTLESKSLTATGMHVLRENGGNFTVLRCGSVKDRFGQADQLHAEIFYKGLNIAIDGGSYLYNDELQYHKYFMGTRSHNTVSVDKEDQMYLHRRFKWLYWTEAKLLKFDPNDITEGEHYGYKRVIGEVTHRRSLKVLKQGCYLIQDSLIQKRSHLHTYTLHWLIGNFAYQIIEKEMRSIVIELHTSKGNYYLAIKTGGDADFDLVKAKDDGDFPEGWHSRYYGEKLPALSISASYLSETGASFASLFSDDRELIHQHVHNLS